MSDPQWYYIKNWFKFQHYKNRRPPWIKLHRSIETDHAFQSLSDSDQYRLIKLWMLASDMDGRVPHDSAYVRSRLRLDHLTHTTNLLARLESSGLISQQDIRGALPTLASTKTETETEIEKKEQVHAPTTVVAAPTKRFVPPTETELIAYMTEQKITDPVNRAHDFIAYYETRGWVPGGQRAQMKSWKAAVRTWKIRDNGNGNKNVFQIKMDAKALEDKRLQDWIDEVERNENSKIH